MTAMRKGGVDLPPTPSAALGSVPGVSSRHESRRRAPAPAEPDSGPVLPAVPAQRAVWGRAPTGSPAGPGEDALGRRLRGRLAAAPAAARYVAVLAMLSAAAAVVLRHTVFPLLSVNNDEGIYLLHARTLAEGRLFPPAPHPAQSYLPWLGTVVDDHYVLKYTPFVPAVFAASLFVAGSIDPALAVIAAAAVVVTYLLGVELSGSRRVAALAATLLALSPLVLLQSAMVLSYLPALVLLQATMLGVLRGRRLHRAPPVLGAGVALGVAAAVRPYDVVLLLAPLAVWLLVTSAGRCWWLVRWLVCGLAAPAVIVLLTNAAATGSPLRLPFALLEPDDRIGFGLRKLYPADGRHDFGLTDGLSSVGDHLWLLGGWAFGGVVLAAASLAAGVRRRLSAPAAMLGLGGLLFLIGYVCFWGAWNAAELWGGIRYLGPFYMVAVLIPLVHLGATGCAWGAAALVARGRRLGFAVLVPVVAAVVTLTVVVLTGAVRDNLVLTGNDRELRAMLRRLPDRPLVFVAANPAFLGHPTPVTANGPDLDDPVLYAVARGVDDLTVVADHPDRPAYLLRLAPAYDRSPGSPSTARVERLAVRAGDRVAATVAVPAGATPPRSRSARLVLTAGRDRLSIPVDPRAATSLTFTVDDDGLGVDDLALDDDTGSARPGAARKPAVRPTATVVRGGRGTSVAVTLYATDRRGHEHAVDQQILPVRLAAGRAAPDRGGPAVTVLGSVGQVDEVGTGARPPLRVSLADAGAARGGDVTDRRGGEVTQSTRRIGGGAYVPSSTSSPGP
ncbi:PMT family glycosyltransferase, 4-amino-4-deoxy-L-arabinose transferase [Frankia torreyi]|uniref:PMT family glycosyltransferase, 4-amino-4-deoxy-L-arabinose transferase n=2 Tax=Frankiaceae TaxID=74712 RepID=A0A0D8BPW2_9ACTN|nr:PMT family glycosyltransferase, 4-amino-4-deoxy-L-arabinose transferase [Frankia torreyi]KQM04782.1 PMT family glycosyltransferase, 4-amino-4-deoxy-L-arabinose transferase [Frankia sp. CpI1-P]